MIAPYPTETWARAGRLRRFNEPIFLDEPIFLAKDETWRLRGLWQRFCASLTSSLTRRVGLRRRSASSPMSLTLFQQLSPPTWFGSSCRLCSVTLVLSL